MSRNRGRTDSNQIEIVATLRLLGCTVVSLAPIGHGCPDLAVAIQGKTYLIEVKDGEKYWKFTPDQKDFALHWDAQIIVLESIDDAHSFVGSVRKNKLVEWLKARITAEVG